MRLIVTPVASQSSHYVKVALSEPFHDLQKRFLAMPMLDTFPWYMSSSETLRVTSASRVRFGSAVARLLVDFFFNVLEKPYLIPSAPCWSLIALVSGFVSISFARVISAKNNSSPPLLG